MKTKTALLFASAVLMACVSHAASVTAREVNSSSKFKLDPKYRSSNWAANSYDQTRVVEISVQLKPAELSAGVTYEVAYIDPTQPAATAYKVVTAPVDALSFKAAQTLVWEAANTRKDAWAVRVLVGGKAVAWAAENEKALAWVKGL